MKSSKNQRKSIVVTILRTALCVICGIVIYASTCDPIRFAGFCGTMAICFIIRWATAKKKNELALYAGFTFTTMFILSLCSIILPGRF